MSLVRRRAVVVGRVQGVSFRWTCRTEAERLGVAGWVRNRADGAVELEAEGPPESVAALLDWCRTGPPAASITSVEVTDVPVQGERTFAIVR